MICVLTLCGCSASESKPHPRDTAVQDPMNYNPAGQDKYDVSGGGLLEFDRGAFGKDVDSVLSP